ncbi:unnamed protein product [Adineta ricciae]|uniref:Nuclear receptor domain-containing protein n=1 Tax=Adineta ricciae TaxID=249248 RepID=A0A815T9B3_ADIRI|nr:unnamed protein product [Adineta ricciae]CAF1527559.1 unnamed protein product [Adineta ricciae]
MMQTSQRAVQKSSRIFTRQCRICDAPAQYSYFGTVSCYPCKMFFRRHALSTKKDLKCTCNGQYASNIRICTLCRLTKCFQSGMSIDRFRSSKQNTLLKLSRQPTVWNFSQVNQSLLTNNQWALLSNLHHSYKESHLLTIGQSLHDLHYHSHLPYTTYETLVNQFVESIYDTTGDYLHMNHDLRELPFHERSIVLRVAVANVTCMTSVFSIGYCHLYNLNNFLHFMKMKYGKYVVDIQCWAAKYIDQDLTVNKMAIALFAVSEDSCSYSTKISTNFPISSVIIHIQHRYVEVIWKYLIVKYGYSGAVKRFLNLTLWILAMKILTSHAETVLTHVDHIDSLVEQIELKFILDDIEHILETNS